jgi:Fe-S-cluster containining protein
MKTPQQKVDWINSQFGTRFNKLLNEAAALAESPDPINSKARRLVEIHDYIADKLAPHSACKRGCSYCCNQSVAISAWEAARIGRASGRTPANVVGFSASTDFSAIPREHSGTPCPFLKGGECSVYDVRPLACRIHFNMGDDPEQCDIINSPGAKVPYFHSKPLLFATAAMFINADVKYADVRAFFPDEVQI